MGTPRFESKPPGQDRDAGGSTSLGRAFKILQVTQGLKSDNTPKISLCRGLFEVKFLMRFLRMKTDEERYAETGRFQVDTHTTHGHHLSIDLQYEDLGHAS